MTENVLVDHVLRGLEQICVVLEHVDHRRPLPGEHLVAESALLGVAYAPEQTLLHLDTGDDGQTCRFKLPLHIS